MARTRSDIDDIDPAEIRISDRPRAPGSILYFGRETVIWLTPEAEAQLLTLLNARAKVVRFPSRPRIAPAIDELKDARDVWRSVPDEVRSLIEIVDGSPFNGPLGPAA